MKSILLLSALLIAAGVNAQPAAERAAAVKSLVESQNFVFRAQTAMPIHGPVRNLTDLYDLTISKSAIISYLPYYGRAYTAVDPTQNPMQFTSKNFDYILKPHKKSGWDVTIRPNDQKDDVQQLILSISSDGYGNLQAIFNNHDAISYTGAIISPPEH